jgi:dienelactone hydrolase
VNTDIRKTCDEAPLLMHLGEEDEFISKTAQAEIKAALAKKPNTTVYSYPGQAIGRISPVLSCGACVPRSSQA